MGKAEMMRHLLLGAALLAMPAGEADADAVSMGSGVATCATFAKDDAGDPALAEPVYFSWALGYMSALNLESLDKRGRYRDLTAMRMDDEKSALRKYCEDHPQAYFMRAIHSLYDSLPERRYRREP